MFNWFKKDNTEEVSKAGKGLKPSPLDKRDRVLSSQMPPIKRIPPKKPIPFDLFMHDQGLNPSCVGHSSSTIKEGNELKEKTHRVFDGEWLYKECKKIDGFDGAGTYLRTALKVLKNKGVKPKNKDEDPAKYKIESYSRIDDLSFRGIKEALAVYDFVLAGFKGSNKGWRNEVIRPPKDGEKEWGHAVALVGYTEDYLLGQNSWGDNFWVHDDSGGYFKVPKDYLPFEAWVVTLDSPNEIKTVGDEIRGWVASEYVTTKDGNKVTTYRLNLRKHPSTEATIIETLDKGAKIKTNGDEESIDGYTWIPVLE